MSLSPCPECERSISSQARACPHCGYPLVEPWSARLERAWRAGFRHAWIAAAGVPAVVFIPALALGGALEQPQALVDSLPWLLIFGGWGFVAGLLAIGAGALLRRRWVGEADSADLWRWSVPAALIVVGLFGAWVSVAS